MTKDKGSLFNATGLRCAPALPLSCPPDPHSIRFEHRQDPFLLCEAMLASPVKSLSVPFAPLPSEFSISLPSEGIAPPPFFPFLLLSYLHGFFFWELLPTSFLNIVGIEIMHASFRATAPEHVELVVQCDLNAGGRRRAAGCLSGQKGERLCIDLDCSKRRGGVVKNSLSDRHEKTSPILNVSSFVNFHGATGIPLSFLLFFPHVSMKRCLIMSAFTFVSILKYPFPLSRSSFRYPPSPFDGSCACSGPPFPPCAPSNRSTPSSWC